MFASKKKKNISKFLKIKKNDNVFVIAGKDKGKSGRVVKVFRKKGRVLIEGINIVQRHMRPTQKQQQGGIIKKEAPLEVSNVMLKCNKCNKATRVGSLILEDGRKVRVCKRCEEIFA
ncbi:MAG: 50S ribosomal protein L24 [bacterium]